MAQLRIVQAKLLIFVLSLAHQLSWLQSQRIQYFQEFFLVGRGLQVLDDLDLDTLLFKDLKCGAGFTAARIVVDLGGRMVVLTLLSELINPIVTKPVGLKQRLSPGLFSG